MRRADAPPCAPVRSRISLTEFSATAIKAMPYLAGLAVGSATVYTGIRSDSKMRRDPFIEGTHNGDGWLQQSSADHSSSLLDNDERRSGNKLGKFLVSTPHLQSLQLTVCQDRGPSCKNRPHCGSSRADSMLKNAPSLLNILEKTPPRKHPQRDCRSCTFLCSRP